MAAGGGGVIVLDDEGPPAPPHNGNAAAPPGRDPDSLRAENRRLFREFVDFCSQHTKEHPEVIPYLVSRHQKANPSFLASVEFRNTLGRCLTRVQAKRSKVYVYINELCTVFKAHSQRRKLALSGSTSGPADATKASAAPADPSELQAEPPQPQRGSKRQIRYLENLLQVHAVEIRRLQERELSLEEMDREDSAYLQENHLKRRMVRIFERLCELKDCNSLTGRVIEQRIPYRGTRYPEVNRRIERLINRPEAFPDYNDILKAVQKANSRHSLGLPKRQMESMAADAFRDVGNRLQERRHLDLVYNFGSHLTDQYRPGSDPALGDAELARCLRHNREQSQQRLEQVVSRYAQLQDTGEEEERRRKRGQLPTSTSTQQQGEPASPSAGREGRLSPRAAKKEAKEEEEEEEEEEDSSSESDIEAEWEKSLEGGGDEEEEEGPAPDEEDPPAQEVEADQHMGPEVATEVPEVILYSSTEEEEEEDEEDEEEAAAAAAAEEREEEGPQGVGAPQELPRPPLFVLEMEGVLPLESRETPPPSPLPWTQEGGFPLRKGPPPIKRSRALENGGSGLADQTSLREANGEPPPCKRGRQELGSSSSPLSSSCIQVPSGGSSEEDEEEGLCRPPTLHSPAPVADSTWADSPGLALVTSSQGSPAPTCKASVATQCDPEEIIVLSDSD